MIVILLFYRMLSELEMVLSEKQHSDKPDSVKPVGQNIGFPIIEIGD